jgi:phosphohistidine swiveling domain-containing protein
MKKILENQHWIKILTRDIPFIRLAMIYESHCQGAKKDIGWNYPDSISVLRKGIFHIYRSREGIDRYNKNFLRTRNKKQFFEKILRRTKLAKEKALRDIKFCESKLKLGNKLTNKELLNIFKILYLTFKKFWNLQYLPMALESSLNSQGKEEIILRYKKYLVAIRKQTQYTTVKLEDLIDSTLKRVAKDKELSGNLILYAKPSEIIKDKLTKKDLIERKKASLFVLKGNKLFIYQGKKAKNLANVISLEKSLTTKEIKGKPVYQGKAKGLAKVVLYRKDLKNLKRNQILVTPMTEAYYTPYLKKVKAIITDEGGITCHAAIISRELGIPCIIGTKIATKVLKDGDLVEMDASAGMVRILKRVKHN